VSDLNIKRVSSTVVTTVRVVLAAVWTMMKRLDRAVRRSGGIRAGKPPRLHLGGAA
jgi:hypothetical protein